MENVSEKELTREEKARIAQNAYRKEWRAKNREKVRERDRESQIKFWSKKYDEMKLSKEK